MKNNEIAMRPKLSDWLESFRAICTRFHLGTTQASIVVASVLLLSLFISPEGRLYLGVPLLLYVNVAILYFYASGVRDLIRNKQSVVLLVYSIAYSLVAFLMDSFIASYFFIGNSG